MDSESVVAQVQRKIELQSPEDLAYLMNNVRNAAAARLNQALPQVDGNLGEDELRNQIEALVEQYINQLFEFASPNLSINGLPVPESLLDSSAANTDPAYEPFDARKRQRVADLITQEEKLLEEVAALKRSVPVKAAAEHADSVRDAIKADEEALRQRTEQAAEVSVQLAIEDLERQDSVEGVFRNAIQGLGRLKSKMPTVVADMERARKAGEYVGSEKKR